MNRPLPLPKTHKRAALPERAPLWYKDAIIYELRVAAFQDSNDDGLGDFRGLAQRLDYLHDLGVTALWLLPFSPSPMRDDGYDISDYSRIHPDVGTLDDFKVFLREAHRHGLRVITELVINHTSDQHPWFQRARRAPPGSRWRNFYVWSDTPEKYPEARIIFKDFEPSNWAWDSVAKAYYWHRFYTHQPDLNFDSLDVRKAIFKVLDFWLAMGVDGLRLDAIPYLFEREGTNCENLAETHAFLQELRRHVDERYEDRLLLAEANQWPEDAVNYFGHGDECHMAFHFPIMPRLFMALHMEDRFPIIDILTQTPAIPETCQWALFLRNHDELTLEMVTDEERDYMYRVYAHDAQARINLGIRRRLAPLLGRDRRRMELMNALLFSLPGTPVLYYGDEIGMGDNIYLGDRNSVRTPMQWSADRNAGFSRANPQRLHLPVIVDPEYHYESTNVEAQQNNPHSWLWFTKRLIAMRKRYKAFGRGTITFLQPSNRKVLAFIRRHEEERVLVVANLSRFVQYVELDLSACKGRVAVELFGRTLFPPIGDVPYLLTLGPHAFYWFSLEPRATPVAVEATPQAPLPRLRVTGSWSNVFRGPGKDMLAKVLPGYLLAQRWFGGKAQGIRTVRVTDVIPIENGGTDACFTMLAIEQGDGSTPAYALPLAFAPDAGAEPLRQHAPHALVAELTIDGRASGHGVLYDAVEDAGFCALLLDAIGRRRQFKGRAGELVATPTRAYRALRGTPEPLPVSVLRVEQSNSSVVYGDRLIFKFVRRLTEGMNPELEVGRFLTERGGFSHTPPVAGAVEYRVGRHDPVTVGILQGYVAHEGDAWNYTLDQVRRYVERVLTIDREHKGPALLGGTVIERIDTDPPAQVLELVGPALESARLLGRRTAELHLALACAADDPAFAPEPFTTLYQRSLYQSMRNLRSRVFQLLNERLASLPSATMADARKLLTLQDRVEQTFHTILGRKIAAMRIRCHGDYHLGQVLHTGKDFVIVDFEGEPTRSLADRRLKRSTLRDVAGMLRSYDYAVHHVLLQSTGPGVVRPEDVPVLEPWARVWRLWVSSAFMRAYVGQMGDSPLIPHTRAELDLLLRVLMLEKAVYELGYELSNRPGWVSISIKGILDLIGADSARA